MTARIDSFVSTDRSQTSAWCRLALILTFAASAASAAVPPDWLQTGPATVTRRDGTVIATTRLLDASGAVWMGRGANLYDTRSCSACTFEPLTETQVAEVNRRADTLIGWGANFVHLVMESFNASERGGRIQWRNVYADSRIPLDPAHGRALSYLQSIQQIVEHMTAKGVYVMLYLHNDPCLGRTNDANAMNIGAPDPKGKCDSTWRLLATTFRANPRVMFGLASEPKSVNDGAPNDCTSLGLCDAADTMPGTATRNAYNREVGIIRAVEAQVRPTLPNHIVAVQGWQGYGRDLSIYLTKPITAGGGKNVVYETHPYNKQTDFDRLVFTPARKLPVIIGEFGPFDLGPVVNSADVKNLMARAEDEKVPYTGWVFHERCPPDLLIDYTENGIRPPPRPAPQPPYDACNAPAQPDPGTGATRNQMPLNPSPYTLHGQGGRPTWGALLKQQLGCARDGSC